MDITTRLANEFITRHGLTRAAVDALVRGENEAVASTIIDEMRELDPAVLGLIINTGKSHSGKAAGRSMYDVHIDAPTEYDGGPDQLAVLAAKALIARMDDLFSGAVKGLATDVSGLAEIVDLMLRAFSDGEVRDEAALAQLQERGEDVARALRVISGDRAFRSVRPASASATDPGATPGA